ncbi:MAG: flotillin family protein [Bacteroidia bacterium]|nr:flotillin family protein [Bacteroidia bacterium]
MDLLSTIGIIIGAVIFTIVIGYVLLIRLFYRKINQGQALVRTGYGETKVAFNGMWVIPLLHNAEVMDISLKQVIINRDNKDGLICKDNLRADIKVAFYVRVNPTVEDVKMVANTIGCARASDPELLNVLFESKFSEALKTIGKRFDFVELYDAREKFRDEIINLIGRQLNGYFLDDAAIDYLEQTPVQYLDEDNILDAEGIKKIRDLTARQITQANKIQREKEKEIKKQDVEAREAILELEKQQAEKEDVQRREVASVKARESAETLKVQEEERTKSDRARINREREIEVEEQNKMRDVIAAKKNKERTEAIETEKVERDRELEATERERIVELARIEKEKALEVERKNIQDVIRDRVAVEREVVEEREKIKDTEAFQGAEREKKVAILAAEQRAEAALVERLKKAEADKDAAVMEAERRITEATANREAADKDAESKKIMADATAEEHAALGLAEARVLEAKAQAREKEGLASANALEFQNKAEAKGIELKGEAQAEADRKKGQMEAKISLEKGMADAQVLEAKAAASEKMGTSEAKVIEMKALADAKGVQAKAEAMKKLDGVGKEHEEFKLRLEKDKEVELAHINIQQQIAAAQAQVLSEALKAAHIDIVGGDQQFFDRLSGAITNGKYVDRLFSNSEHLLDAKQALLGDGNGHFGNALRTFMEQFSFTSEDVKNLTVSALIAKLLTQAGTEQQKSVLSSLQGMAASLGLANQKASNLLG